MKNSKLYLKFSTLLFFVCILSYSAGTWLARAATYTIYPKNELWLSSATGTYNVDSGSVSAGNGTIVNYVLASTATNIQLTLKNSLVYDGELVVLGYCNLTSSSFQIQAYWINGTAVPSSLTVNWIVIYDWSSP